ncbi:MAG: hypothetical protein HY909_22795 [Deltaproteobacteria bacterium]|nr:hypothetical protein [Deltaproteobacteria bacterium]
MTEGLESGLRRLKRLLAAFGRPAAIIGGIAVLAIKDAFPGLDLALVRSEAAALDLLDRVELYLGPDPL